MAFDAQSAHPRGKRVTVAFNTNKALRTIVLKTDDPVVLSGGIITSAGSGAVDVTACRYLYKHWVRTAPAKTAMAITSTHHVYVDVDTNEIKSAATTPAGHLKLGSGTHAGGAVTVTMDRLRLRVAADAGTEDLD